MSEWYMMIPLMVFTKIKQNFSQTIKETYKMTDANFSTVGSSDAPAVFPFVYVKTLPSSEISSTFEQGVNGANFGFQVEVTDNQTQTKARKVMEEISRIMVDMGFRIQGFGEFEDTTNTHRTISRFQRVFGANDTL